MTMGYSLDTFKVQTSPSWTKYLMSTHPIVFITTIGKIDGVIKTDVAPFATCLDTSYNPPYIQFSCAVKQHVPIGKKPSKEKMNTFLNIKQNGLFVINVPPKSLLYQDAKGKWPAGVLDIIAKPYPRKKLADKIALARLTKIFPFVLSKKKIYPPLIKECLAHLECEVIDIHRPKGSDHYNITGKVVGASYESSLGTSLDEVRKNLVSMVWHHFGSRADDSSKRLIGYFLQEELITDVNFALEKKPKK